MIPNQMDGGGSSGQGPRARDLKVALASAAVALPQMDFVVDHSRRMVRTETRLFTFAAKNGTAAGFPVREGLSALPMPYELRRRAYPVSGLELSSAIHRWHPDVVHLHFIALGGFAVSASRRAQVPLVTTVHAMDPSLLNDPGSPRETFLRRNCEAVLESTTLFLAVSELIRTWLMSLGVHPSRILTHYLGIDEDLWRPVSRASARLMQRRITFIGHLTRLKGVLDLVDASKALVGNCPHTLTLIGDGPLRGVIQDEAGRYPHIAVQGRLDKSAIRDVLTRSTVLVLPTMPDGDVVDAAPTVLLEAQSMGVPAIAYATGGVPEMLATHELLVSTGDVEDLVQTMEKVLLMDDCEYQRLSASVRDWVVASRSMNAAARRTRSILEELVDSV